MKKWVIAIAMFLSFSLVAQNNKVKVETAYLSNGMKLILCEDHATPEIHGGVLVHVGSRNDPEEATGMAHYFEHIMFKGTDRMGTVDWEKEKIYLDSITLLYDQLHFTAKKQEREKIQLKINELSVISAAYAIPNEMDAILNKMGGKGVNAYTSHDVTVYYNRFPSNQLEKWMSVYYERFRYPVFRLFQSELETVYEEQNKYADDLFERAAMDLFKTVFGDHPYSNPILGHSEHLKNPQLSKMYTFFNTYYVPCNMTLILSGDMNIEEAKLMAENTFGKLKSAPKPEIIQHDIPEWRGKVEVTRRLTPVKAGVLGFKTVSAKHEDYYKIELLRAMFTNSASTGLLDQLVNDNKIYISQCISYSFKELGLIGMIYVPKIFRQSLKSGESLVGNCIDSIRNGHFSDQFFEAIKMDYLSQRARKLENSSSLFHLLIDAETQGNSWQNYLDEQSKVAQLTKADIVETATKYLGNDYLSYRTKMGFSKKDKIAKPNWKPIIPKNSDAKSPFAEQIEKIEVKKIKPQTLDFQQDITIDQISDGYDFYSIKNPYNDIFNLVVYFKYGNNLDPDLGNAYTYFQYQGTATQSFEKYKLELQSLGASFRMGANALYSYISIQGFEKDLDKILQLCAEKINAPSNDESKLKMMYDDKKMDYRLTRFSPSSWSTPLYYFANYGENSPYLTEPSCQRIKAYSGQELLDLAKKPMEYDGFITYSGNLEPEKVKSAILTYIPLAQHSKEGTVKTNPKIQNKERELFYIQNGNVRQSRIRFNINGEKYATNQQIITANSFNNYFGNGMNSIVFQEIREFRSLAYSASASYSFSFLNQTLGSFTAFVETQSDKTLEGIDVLSNLINNLPRKDEKFSTAKEAYLQNISSEYIHFRSIPYQVHYWLLNGETEDPRSKQLQYIETLCFEDIANFHKTFIADRPIRISMVGNFNKIKKRELEKYGIIKKVRFGDIYKK